MANVNVAAVELGPLGGATNSGIRVGLVKSATKATKDDTLTITNAKSVEYVVFTRDSTGVVDPVTVATNVVTLTGANAGPVSGIVYYK